MKWILVMWYQYNTENGLSSYEKIVFIKPLQVTIVYISVGSSNHITHIGLRMESYRQAIIVFVTWHCISHPFPLKIIMRKATTHL